MKIFSKLISNQSGAFSLIEVVIGAGMLAALAMTASSYYSQTRKAQRLIELETALESYYAAFTKIVQDAGTCNSTFKDQFGVYELSAPSQIILKQQGTHGIGLAENAVQGDVYISTGQWIKDIDSTGKSTETWKIESFDFPTPGGTNGIIAPQTPAADRVLLVTYSLNPKIGNKKVVKKIPLTLRFVTSNTPDPADDLFFECVSSQASTVNNFQNTMCNSINPEDASGGNVVAYWDEESQKCIFEAADPSCPAGQTLKGVNADGTLNCMATDEGVDERVIDETPTTCAAGQSIKMRYIGNKLSIVCE